MQSNKCLILKEKRGRFSARTRQLFPVWIAAIHPEAFDELNWLFGTRTVSFSETETDRIPEAAASPLVCPPAATAELNARASCHCVFFFSFFKSECCVGVLRISDDCQPRPRQPREKTVPLHPTPSSLPFFSAQPCKCGFKLWDFLSGVEKLRPIRDEVGGGGGESVVGNLHKSAWLMLCVSRAEWRSDTVTPPSPLKAITQPHRWPSTPKLKWVAATQGGKTNRTCQRNWPSRRWREAELPGGVGGGRKSSEEGKTSEETQEMDESIKAGANPGY